MRLLVVVLVLILSACGGNAGKASNETAGPVSLSSAASSSSSSLSCTSGNGVIFSESVCANWMFKIWEAKNDYSVISPFINQDGTNLTAKIIDSGEVAHGKVFDMSFNSVTDWSALPQFRAADAANKDGVGFSNLSEFSTGKISFDIKVIANPNKSKIFARFECDYPCTTNDFDISIPSADTGTHVEPNFSVWTHVEYSIQDLIAKGLNLKNVDVAFEVSPEWAKQAGVHFQLDNIRWEKGAAGTVATTYCYSDFLDTDWVNNVRGPGVTTRVVSGSVDLFTGGYVITGVNPWVKIKPNWRLVKGTWDVSVRKGMDYVTREPLEPLNLSTCSGAGVLSMDVYIPKSYVNDATLKFTLHFADKFEKVFPLSNATFNVFDMKPDEWNKISVNLSSATQHPDLLYVGLTFQSLLVNPSITDTIGIDNILITTK